MFNHLIFKIKYFRTIKDICRIFSKYDSYILRKNDEQHMFSKYESIIYGSNIAFKFNELLFHIYNRNFITISFKNKNIGSSTQLFSFNSASFFNEMEINFDAYIPAIKASLNELYSILKNIEKEVLEIKAKEQKEILDDLNKILLKR